MSKTMQHLFDTNSPLTWAKGDGRGLERIEDHTTAPVVRKENPMYPLNPKSVAAHLGWNRKTVKAAMPTMVMQPNWEFYEATTSIPAWDLNGLVQTDLLKYANEQKVFEGYGRSVKETAADQSIDLARWKLFDWQDRKDTFLNPSWHNLEEYLERMARHMTKVTGFKHDPSQMHVVRAEMQYKIERSRRWREKRYKEILEDRIFAVERALEKQADSYEELDESLFLQAETRKPDLFVDERTEEQALWDNTWDYMYLLKPQELVNLTIEYGDNSLFGWKANHMLIEAMVGDVYTIKSKLRRVGKELDKDAVADARRKWNTIWHNPKVSPESAAEEYFAMDADMYEALRLKATERALVRSVTQEYESRRAGYTSKLKAAERAFWASENHPYGVKAILPGQDLCFKDEDDKYLEGSCTEVKYELNCGVTVSLDQIPEEDPESSDVDESLFNPVVLEAISVPKRKRIWGTRSSHKETL
jgi:hypothetical protein